MTKRDALTIDNHQDADLFREALNYTAATTKFPVRLIEKDYFCTVLLALFAREADDLVFKGGTCPWLSLNTHGEAMALIQSQMNANRSN
jgi:hypothetical protein